MAGVSIKNEEQLADWLGTKPEEWSRIIAVRVALRVLPISALFFEQRKASEHSELLAISTFRAASVGWAALRYPEMSNRDLSRRSITAARRGYRDLENFRMSSRSGRPLEAAARAAEVVGRRDDAQVHEFAANAALAAAAAAGDYAARGPVERNDERADAARTAAAEIWRGVAYDATALIDANNSEDVKVVLESPLWATDPPKWVPSSLRRLSTSWRELDVNSSIWSEWASSRIYGHNSLGLSRRDAQEFDLRLATQPGAWWARPPNKINEEISDWVGVFQNKRPEKDTISSLIMEYLFHVGRAASISEITDSFRELDIAVIPKTVRGELSRLASSGQITRVGHGLYEAFALDSFPPIVAPLEQQTKGAIQFESLDNQPIEVKHRASVGELRIDSSAQRRHKEVRRRVDQLLVQYSANSKGANAAKILIDEIELFSESLGSTIDDLDPDLLIPRGDGLRRDAVAYRNRDDFSVLPPISDDLILSLEKTISDYNNYVSFDPELAIRDEALLGPDARKRIVPPADGQSVIEDAVQKHVARQNVVDSLSEEAKVAPAIPDPESRQSRRYSEGAKNFARKAIELSVEFVKATRRATPYALAAGGTGYAAAQWVWANQQWLLTYFAENPVMLKIVQDLLNILKTLPLS